MLCGANKTESCPLLLFLKDRSDSKFLIEQYPWNSHRHSTKAPTHVKEKIFVLEMCPRTNRIAKKKSNRNPL